MKLLILAAIVGAVIAQSQYNQRGGQQRKQSQYEDKPREQINERQFSTTTYVPILSWNKEQEHDGTYRTSYETGNNIIAEESGHVKTIGVGVDKSEALVQQGSYSYTSPEGQVITIHYTADETGFHATGDHIPTSPPVSVEIQKGLDLIYEGIRQREEAATHVAQNQPLKQQIDRREDNNNYRR